MLNHAEVIQYSRDKPYAMMMFMSASEDYTASRCCILNMLQTGFRLASESVEKLLKAFIYLETGERTRLIRNDLHNPLRLKQELRQTHQDQRLDAFDPLLMRLFDHFQTRYYDNATSGEGASGDELAQIDSLFIYLVETLPMPDEVKYRSKFFADLFEPNARKYWRSHYWITERNLALAPKLETMEKTYQKVFKHLYPSPIGAIGG
jgi:hypothetical protein